MPMYAIRDVSLFVKVVGHGYPLLLMHGGPGLDHTTLDALEPLAHRFTLVFYDHRGNGRSTGAAATMTFDNLVADAEALREMLGFERWAVLGHSFGGHVALEYALRHPERVSHLILMDTFGDARRTRESAPAILARRGYGAGAVEAARRFFGGELRPKEMLPLVRKFLRAYFYRIRLRDAPHAVVAAFRMKMRPEALVFGFGTLLRNWSVMDRLGEITMPTLVLAGREDFLYPPEHQAILADRIPGARLEIVEHAGHNPQDEQPLETLRILREFLGAPEAQGATRAAHAGAGIDRQVGADAPSSPFAEVIEART